MESRFTLISRNIIAIEKYFKLYLKDKLKKFGFKPAEGLVLYALYIQPGADVEYGGKTPEQLCALL